MFDFIKKNIFIIIIFITSLSLGFLTFLTFIDKSFISLTETNLQFLLIVNIILLVIFLVIIFIIYLITKSLIVEKLSLSLVLGGALGNFWDRFTYYAVPDFIDIHFKSFHWFTFNIADIFITIGIIILLSKELFTKNEKN